ncbi:diguanylate cyclase [Synechocystis salina LEGE 06155]|nr:diguanylate cyclase [Synechocystis salina LEGE 06155]
MSHYLVNETLMVVDEEIDQFLLEFPRNHPFAMALSIPYFRLELKARVLSKIPNRHKTREEKSSQFFPDHDLPNIIVERLAVENEIRRIMPDMINSGKNNLSLSEFSPPQTSVFNDVNNGNDLSVQVSQLPWWVKIHTMMPCVTYYFGPFTSRGEAKTFAPGYVEDLKAEKAVGIFTSIHRGNPCQLTIIDCPEELKQDQKKLWENYKKLYRQKSEPPITTMAVSGKLDLLPGNHLVTDLQGKIKDASANACRLLNFPIEALRGEPLVYYVPQQQILIFESQLKAMVSDEEQWSRPYRWSMQLQTLAIAPISVDIQVSQQRNAQGQLIGFYWLLNDITSLKSINDQLYYDSRHDTLTSLPNRRSLSHFLTELLSGNDYSKGQLFALLLLDLNKFKQINDKFGHAFGDKVLRKVAENLLSCIREGDQVARLSGDEFVVVLKSIQSVNDAKNCAYRIHHTFSEPMVLNNHRLSVSASIGIVIGNGSQADHDRLLHHADVAMYEAKKNGILFVVFDDMQPSANGKSHPVPVYDLSLSSNFDLEN